MIKIRKAKKRDYKTLIKLYVDFVGDKRYADFNNDSFLKVIKNKNSFLDLVILKNKIIGFISYSIRNVIRYPRPIIEVEELYVLPEYRLKGIGNKLMKHVINICKNKNCHYLFLASDKKRKTAHKFYKALGFDEYAYHFRKRG